VKAVVIGPGRVGCGLVGQALRRSGYEVVFVARTPDLARHLNSRGHYRVRLVHYCIADERVVDGVRAVHVGDELRVVDELAEADVIATCVRPRNLKAVAPLIAAGLSRRLRPANVLVFENLVDAGAVLKRLVASALPGSVPLDRHGFAGVVVDRAVSQRLGGPGSDSPLTFVGDFPERFLVDASGLRKPIPTIAGMVVTDDYPAVFRRKLCTFSAGHAVTAYLGHLKGYRYIHSAVRDPEIRAHATAAMEEAQEGLSHRYGRSFAGGRPERLAAVARFENAALDDPIVRVGREPDRKLSPSDRLVGPAALAEAAGVWPENLALGIAAALCFSHPRDISSLRLQTQLYATGVEQVLRRVCRLDPGGVIGRRVAEQWVAFRAGAKSKNLLLSLDRVLWAWEPDGRRDAAATPARS
jgi:mannitol-1-phosphate 5-dehydrogenase